MNISCEGVVDSFGCGNVNIMVFLTWHYRSSFIAIMRLMDNLCDMWHGLSVGFFIGIDMYTVFFPLPHKSTKGESL